MEAESVVELLKLLNVLYMLYGLNKYLAERSEKRKRDDAGPEGPRLPQGKKRKLPWVPRPRLDKNGTPTHGFMKRNYKESTWWAILQDDHADGPRNPNSKLGKDFRKDFRVPFKVFQFIVDMAKSRNWMSVAVVDACGRTGIPIELQILGVLYILGGDHKFRSVEKLGNFSGESMRVFFIAFVSAFSCDLFDIWVCMPRTKAEIARITDQYAKVGLPGCVGSIDCTHVGVDRMPAGLKNLLTGKEGYPTLSFEVKKRG
jgi:hypothetical protein